MTDVELQREPEGWQHDERISKAWFSRQNEFTIAAVITAKGNLYVGTTKQHPDDPYDAKVARQLALQRCQKVCDEMEIADALYNRYTE